MYVALDIETTGLDPQRHQVLEIAMVADVRDMCVRDCPAFHEVIAPDGDIVGHPRALVMNQNLLKNISDGYPALTMEATMSKLRAWLRELPIGPLYLLGKNVGSFDRPFMKQVEEWPDDWFSYRTLDIGSLYATHNQILGQTDLLGTIPQDFAIPGQEHEALFDARCSLALARAKWGIEI